jgi:hypothetical protein
MKPASMIEPPASKAKAVSNIKDKTPMNTDIQPKIPLLGFYEDASISCLAYAGRRPPGGIFSRCGEWLRRLEAEKRLRELDPRLARDIGIAVGRDWRQDGSPVEALPLLRSKLAF